MIGVFFSPPKERKPPLPKGGLVETPEEIAEYKSAVPPFSPSENTSSLSFEFNGEKILFTPGEKRKDIFSDSLKYSPKVVIPWGVNWHLETLDSTDVWFKDGGHVTVYPGMKTIDVKRKVAIFRFRSQYPVTVWLN